MPFDVDTSGAPAVLRITMGPQWPTLEEQRSWRKKAVENGWLTPDTRALIDARALTELPRYGELDQIIEAAVRDGGLPHHRAYLTATVAQFGVARQIQLMSPDTISVMVFSDAAEAEAWLNA